MLNINNNAHSYRTINDKICYKLVAQNIDDPSILSTVYFKVPVKLDEIYTSDLKKEISFNVKFLGKYVIQTGMHSIFSKKYAKILASKRKPENGFVIKVAKCVIPSGSEFYSGKFKGYKAFASNNLKYIKIL
jgi:hypothetical protein